MRALAACFVGSIAVLAGCATSHPEYQSASPAAAEPMTTLQADWLDGTTEITPARLERVMTIARKDAVAARILESARTRLGHGSMGELYALFTVCSADVPHDNAGRTTERHDVQVIAPDVNSVAAGVLGADAQKQLDAAKASRDALAVHVEQKPDYVTVSRWLIPHICLTAHESLATAYEALVHELIHALNRDPFSPMPDVLTATPDAFLTAYVLAPGDEVDAYLTAASARVRLEHTTANLLPSLRNAFGPSGNALLTREAMVPRVLDPIPRGAGYRDGPLSDAISRTISAELQIDNAKRDVLTQIQQNRAQEGDAFQKNVGILQFNIGVRKKNIDISKQNGDPAGEARFRSELASDEKDLVHTTTMASVAAASGARVSADLALVNQRIAALSARAAQR